MKVLIADDDSVNRRVLQAFLGKWGYETVVATNGTEAWRLLQEDDAPRLAILDWMMPELDGVEICRKLREINQPTYTYTLLVTARFQKQDIIEGLEAGADDYITKPFDANELRARLRAGRRILELHDQLLSARDRLQFEVSHDSLTGLWSRSAIIGILHAELARARRSETPVGIVMLDLDYFKKVNDRYGHLAGDCVLRAVARTMRSRVRPYDAVGRYGGEEFLLIAPDTDLVSTARQAERLRAAIEESSVETPEGAIPISLSLGVTAACGTSSDANTLLKEADAALYRAKQRGRNCVEVAVPATLAIAVLS